MNLQLNAKNLITVFFILTSLSSLSNIAFATWNYMQYYPATSELYVNLTKVAIQHDPSSGDTTVRSSVSVGNPSDYSGLNLYSEQINIFFFNQQNNETIFRLQPLSTILTGIRPLGTRSTIDSELSIKLDREQAASLTSYTQFYAGLILTHVRVQVQVSSFLDPVIGRLTFEESIDIAPS